jgi:hypothetical protein
MIIPGINPEKLSIIMKPRNIKAIISNILGLLGRAIPVWAFLVVVSCARTAEKKQSNTAADNQPMTGIGVHINAIVPKDDVFEVYYYEPGQTGFNAKDYVFARVKGSSEPQDIYFELPEAIYPERLRLDFGKRQDQGQMSLNLIRLFFNDKDYEFSKSEIVKEFRPSKYLIFDTDEMTLSPQPSDGRYDPYLYTKKVNNIVNYLLED